MNKESKKNLLKFSKEDLIEIMDYMQETLKYQKQKIDKAIEYIGLNEEDLKLYDIYDVNGTELYKILSGKDTPQYLGYSDKECINCGRLRVEKYSDGTEICEKCNYDQNKKEYVMR